MLNRFEELAKSYLASEIGQCTIPLLHCLEKCLILIFTIRQRGQRSPEANETASLCCAGDDGGCV